MPTRRHFTQDACDRSTACPTKFELRSTVGYGLVNTVACVVFGSKWITYFQARRSKSNNEQLTEILNSGNKIPTGIHWWILASYGEDTVVVKYRMPMGEQIYGQWWKTGPAIWEAYHRNSQFEQMNLNIGLAIVNDIITDSGHKKAGVRWVLRQLALRITTARPEACQPLLAC